MRRRQRERDTGDGDEKTKRTRRIWTLQTQKAGKKIGLVLGVVLGLLLLIAVLLFSVRITEIEVSGNQHYTKEQIIDLIFSERWSDNSAYCYYENQFREHKSIPFIEEYTIEFKSPTKVEIVVFEKSVVGYVSDMSSYMYFDKDGIIVESSSEQLPGVPWVTGLEYGHIVLHQPLPVADQEIFEEILNLTQVLSLNEVEVDEIHYNSFGEAELSISGIITVELGDSSAKSMERSRN